MSEDAPGYAGEVRDYWEAITPLYLDHGTTFQGGYVVAPGDPVTARASNLYLAARAGIVSGDRVLDAGCGVCGPSIDIAQTLGEVRIDAVTLSPTQADLAREAVSRAGVADRIAVRVCDYHELPFPDGRFDVAFFMESLYTVDLLRLLTEIRRVLRPGGRLYAKEVFRQDDPLTESEHEAVNEFERVWHYRLRRLGDTAAIATSAGFIDVETADLSPLASDEHYVRAMTELVGGIPLPSELGRWHRRRVPCDPTYFGELRARRPPAPRA